MRIILDQASGLEILLRPAVKPDRAVLKLAD